eukprot:INCI10396.1.p1 GENE.INCI10396.1~~INCI10396.1.p1  ORF type:complete len:398 (+),score=75.06 INCI10396.1:164-1357(+)
MSKKVAVDDTVNPSGSSNGRADIEMANLGGDKVKENHNPNSEAPSNDFECSKLPYCWTTSNSSGSRCQCQQGDGCSCCAVCGWIGVGAVVFVILFCFSAYWPCYDLPVFALADVDIGTNNEFLPLELDPEQPVAAQNRSQQGVVSILNYNVFLRPELVTDPDTALENDFKLERLNLLVEKLDEFDVLLIQETWIPLAAGRKQRFVDLANEAGFSFYVRGRCVGRPIDSMLLILSRHPIVATEEHTFVATLGGEAMASKGILHARIWLNGNASRSVDVFTTHMLAGFDDGDGPNVRSIQTQELVSFIQERRNLQVGPNLPDRATATVFAGDFNINGRALTGSPNEHFTRLVADLGPLNSSGLLRNLVIDDLPSADAFVLPVTCVEDSEMQYPLDLSSR